MGNIFVVQCSEVFSSSNPAGYVSRVFRHAVLLPKHLRDRHRHRKELRRLVAIGPYIIEDMGLKLDEVLFEIEKPIWKT